MQVVAERGYGTTTVADLTSEAGISRTTFYELFPDKQACFLAAYDHAADALIRRINAAFESRETWPEAMRAALKTLLAEFAAAPKLALLGMVDISAAGPAAQLRYRAAVRRLTPLFEEGRDFVPDGRALPANTSRMAIGGVAGLVSEQLLDGRADDLPGLLDDVLLATLSPYIGREAAEGLIAADPGT
jgi:AcrR family transcriptional regulator